MKKITTSQVAQATAAVFTAGGGRREISRVVIDSRSADETALFIAIKGERQDGHIYAEAAARQGCRAFLLSKIHVAEALARQYPDADIVCTEHTVRGLQELSRWYLSQFHPIKVAVTGSTGKTGTKEMLYAILSRRYKTIRNEGNLNNELGLPLTIFQVEEDTEVAVFEMGMSSFGEIRLLADIVRPDLAVITNVGTSHIEFLKSRENILKAKLEVTDLFDQKHVLIVNSDSEYLSLQHISRCIAARQKEDSGYTGHFRLLTAGENGTPDICLSEIEDLGEAGISFRLAYSGVSQEFQIPLLGRHNAHNAMLAVGAGLQLKVPMQEAAEALRQMEATSRRLVIEPLKDWKLIDDTYNSSPDSVAAAAEVLYNVTGGRRVAVLADILELGEQSEALHRQVGREFVCGGPAGLARLLIACGPQARFIAQEAQAVLEETEAQSPLAILYFPDREQLSAALPGLLQKDDVILLKGSNGMQMSLVAQQLRELSQRGCGK